MDIQKAIETHVQWKMKLAAYIKNPDGSVDVDKVGQDSQCELGKWLHSEGKQYATHAECKALIADHARFHLEAAKILTKADSGASVVEEMALGAQSAYAEASASVVRGLMWLKRMVAAA